MPTRLALASSCSFLMLASCGAILSPGPFEVPIDSRPAGAEVLYRGESVGKTPCVVAMHRAASQVELRLVGYHPLVVDVGTTSNPWLAANLLNAGLGILVDLAMGADQNLITDPVLVHLACADGPARAAWLRRKRQPERIEPPIDRSGLGFLVGTLLCIAAGI